MTSYDITFVNPRNDICVLVQKYTTDASAQWNVEEQIRRTANGNHAIMELTDRTFVYIEKRNGKVVVSNN